jgi:xanthine/uracil/vitamin C permease (AzgA family)
MKEVYRSKISLSIVLPIAVIIGGLLIFMLILGAWPGVLIIGMVLAFIIHMFMTTYYTIDGNELYVKCGFIINTRIDIATITKIEPTSTMLSSPALSFDRIEIFYNKYDSVIISPGDKAGFIAKLQQINPSIITA